MMDIRKNFVICLNCGEHGHKSVKCSKNIRSYGIILFKQRLDGELVFLLVQRRDTIGYVDLMRGNYIDVNDPMLSMHFREMLDEEKERLLNFSFEENSNRLWINKRSHFYKLEYENSKKKFATLNLKDLIEKNKSIYTYQSYGFPKGRRHNIHETEIECAIREFSEESNYSEQDIEVYPNFYVSEIFNGSDGITYEQIYWVAKCISDKDPMIDPLNLEQVGEIRQVGWYTKNEADLLFYPDHTEKKRILNEVYTQLKFI